MKSCIASGFCALSLALSPAAAETPKRVRFQPVARAEACPADRAPIMILGTYHMANPGLDAVNVEADDVLSARRQRELAELSERLARFRPTKIMVEAAWSDRAEQQRRYADYLAGRYALTRNEIDQVGFRLAKRAGLATVHPVDFPMFMSGQAYDELDFSRRDAPKPSDAAPAPAPHALSEDELRLRRLSVAENLAWINAAERWLPGHLGYMDLFEPEPGEIAIYAKADNLTNWYKRNFRIWTNVVRVAERPRDRVLLLIGSGHLAILRGLAQDMPGFCLVEPEAYLQG